MSHLLKASEKIPINGLTDGRLRVNFENPVVTLENNFT